MQDIGEAARTVWRKPQFSVADAKRSTEFKHSLDFSLSGRLREKRLATYQMLFATQQVNWKQELAEAYKVATYKSVPVRVVCDAALYQVFLQALQEVSRKAKRSGAKYTDFLGGEPIELMKSARRTRRPNWDARRQRAIRLARRYEQLKRPLHRLRALVKNQLHLGTSELQILIGTKFKADLVKHIIRGVAFENLPDVHRNSKRPPSLENLEWTVRQLAVGIIKCEEDDRNETLLSPNTILKDYLPLGRRLLKRRH